MMDEYQDALILQNVFLTGGSNTDGIVTVEDAGKQVWIRAVKDGLVVRLSRSQFEAIERFWRRQCEQSGKEVR